MERQKMNVAWAIACASALMLVLASPAKALRAELGSDGSDGALNVTTDTVVALPADGVMHYTSITVAAGATLSFSHTGTHHPGAVLLSTGAVVIDGTIDISGADGAPGAGGVAGPGGSPGVAPTITWSFGSGRSASAPGLRDASITGVNGLRNSGGQGGAGSYVSGSTVCTVPGAGGGGGGGALLILANDQVRGSGTIDADGGAADPTRPSSCSAGATTFVALNGGAGNVRLIAPTVELSSLSVSALLFRVDTFDQLGVPSLLTRYRQPASAATARTTTDFTTGTNLDAWPSTLPTATIVSAGGIPVSAGGMVTLPVGTASTFPVGVQVEGCTSSTMTVGVIVVRRASGENRFTTTVGSPTGSDTVLVDVNPQLDTITRGTPAEAFVHCGPITSP